MAHSRRLGRAAARPTSFDRLNPAVAGIDCGASAHFAAVPTDRTTTPVQRFGVCTSELRRLATWLVSCGVTSVAMEATGIYWVPLYEILEGHGLAVVLVNAHHVKQVPGRKSDVIDCEWLRDLHAVGLLRGSVRPPDAIVTLRGYLRHRQTVIENATTAIHRIQKALIQMNLQLPRVVTDIMGVTGTRILRAIIAGERDPAALATHRDVHCHASEHEIQAALTGHYRPEQLLALQQNLAWYEFCQGQLTAVDAALEAYLPQLVTAVPAPAHPLPPARRGPKTSRKNEPRFAYRETLYHLTGGVDLTQIDGIRAYTAMKLLAEIGPDVRRWPTAKHFTSWLTLAPQNKVSGGRLLSSRTLPSANRAAAIFRNTAMTLGRSQTALGAFYRRLAARIGKAQAVVATARKLAILVYHTLRGDFVYRDPGVAVYDQQQRDRVLRRLRQRAGALGFDLVHHDTGAVLVPQT